MTISDVPDERSTVNYPLSDAGDVMETGRLLEEIGAQYHGVAADIRQRVGMDRLAAETIATFGQIDIVVANAAICGFSSFEELTDAQWCEMIDTNLTGTFHTVQAVVRHMRERQYGRIIVISSMSGRSGNRNLAHYVASKFGVIGMVKSIALELATTGITANVVCPSTTSTPMIHND